MRAEQQEDIALGSRRSIEIEEEKQSSILTNNRLYCECSYDRAARTKHGNRFILRYKILRAPAINYMHMSELTA